MLNICEFLALNNGGVYFATGVPHASFPENWQLLLWVNGDVRSVCDSWVYYSCL